MAASAGETPITRRPVVAADTPFLERLYASTRIEELGLLPWGEEQKTAFIRSQFAAQSTHFITHFPEACFEILMLDGTEAGRLYVERRPAWIHIIDIALLPEFRGRGVGTRLLGELLHEAAVHGATVTIHVERHNPAMRLYERLGFKPSADDASAQADTVYVAMGWRSSWQSDQAKTAS